MRTVKFLTAVACVFQMSLGLIVGLIMGPFIFGVRIGLTETERFIRTFSKYGDRDNRRD